MPPDSQIDSIRSLVSLVVGRPALLTPALSGALLLGFLLPAATQRDGQTWAARRAVQVNGNPTQLLLRDEDPELRPGKK